MTSSTTNTTQSVNVNSLYNDVSSSSSFPTHIPKPLKNVIDAIFDCNICHNMPETIDAMSFDTLQGNVFPPPTNKCNCDKGLASRKMTVVHDDRPRFRLPPFVNDEA